MSKKILIDSMFESETLSTGDFADDRDFKLSI